MKDTTTELLVATVVSHHGIVTTMDTATTLHTGITATTSLLDGIGKTQNSQSITTIQCTTGDTTTHPTMVVLEYSSLLKDTRVHTTYVLTTLTPTTTVQVTAKDFHTL